MTDHRAALLRCEEERRRWMHELGEAVAYAAEFHLADLNPEILDRVDPAIVVESLAGRLTADPATCGALRRAHRWAVAQHHAKRGTPNA